MHVGESAKYFSNYFLLYLLGKDSTRKNFLTQQEAKLDKARGL
jgi:hypothetical protein